MKPVLSLIVALTILASNFPALALFTLKGKPTLVSNQILVYEKLEIAFDINEPIINPYNPNEIDIQIIFSSPTNVTFTRNAFYYQEFTRSINYPQHADLTAVNPNATYFKPWRVRFSPPMSGNWTYSIIINQESPVSTGSFICGSSSEKGFVKVDPIKGKSFVFSDNSLFFPLGLNMELYNYSHPEQFYNIPNGYGYEVPHPYFNYEEQLTTLPNWGGNFYRIWMRPTQLEIEWGPPTGPMGQRANYDNRQDRAYELDRILSNAESKGVYIQLCLQTANAFIDDWNSSNPYFSDFDPNNPCTTGKMSFFTDPVKIEQFKRKLRYVVARWGYSAHLFSYELFNEVDLLGTGIDDYWAQGYCPSQTAANGQRLYNNEIISNWHINICNYINSLNSGADRHLITTSTGFAGAGYSLAKLQGIEYVQNHYYTRDYCGEYQINYLARLSSLNYTDNFGKPKPYLLGEFGFAALNATPNSTYFSNNNNFNNSSSTYKPSSNLYDGINKNNVYDVVELHNTLWSSTFSGAGGAGLYWWTGHLFAPWGGQFRYLMPLRKFIDDNLPFLKDGIPVGNTCTNVNNSGFDEGRNASNGMPADRCLPVYAPTVGATPPPLSGISTSDDNNIEVFGLKSDNGTIGWIHYKANYWANVPHVTALPDILPSPSPYNTFSTFPALDNQIMTVSGNNCPGIYEVKFWGTYPSWGDNDGDGKQDDGGVITDMGTLINHNASSTLSSLGGWWSNGSYYVAADDLGNVTIPIPRLAPIGNKGNGPDYEPNAPDYGFRVSYSGGWQHNSLNPSAGSSEMVAGNVVASSDGSHVFFRGGDGRMHQYYSNTAGPTWIHDLVPPASSTQPVSTANDYVAQNSSIASSNLEIFYEGTDGYVHRYYFNQIINDWQHERLTTNPSPPSGETVAGSITCDATGKVFFRGADNKVHQYYRNGTSWVHDWITRWNSSSAENVAGNVAASSDGHIFFRGVDGKLHQYYYGSNGWTHEWVPPFTWNAPASATDDVAPNSSIVPINDAENSVFYQGTNGYIHRYFYNPSVSNWQHEQININATPAEAVAGSITCDATGKVFFRGADNKVHQYYRNGTLWAHGWITGWNSSSTENVAGSVSASSNGHIFFQGTDDKVHQYFYGNICYQNRSSTSTSTTPTPSTLGANHQLGSSRGLVNLSAFPNPTDEFVTIQVSGELERCDLVITDVLGKTVYSTSLQSRRAFELPFRVGSQKVLFARLIRDGRTLRAIKVLGK